METVAGQSANTAAGDDYAVDVAHRAAGAPPPGAPEPPMPTSAPFNLGTEPPPGRPPKVANGPAHGSGGRGEGLRYEEPGVQATDETEEADLLLIYGGPIPASFKEGCRQCWVDDSESWWKYHLPNDVSGDTVIDDIVKDLESASKAKAGATVKPFPVPTLTQGNSDTERREFHQVVKEDGLLLATQKWPGVVRNASYTHYVVRDESYYLWGPVASPEELLDGLWSDPMLGAVYSKWSKLHPEQLKALFKYGKILLQIRWDGGKVRPVRILTGKQCREWLKEVIDGTVGRVAPPWRTGLG